MVPWNGACLLDHHRMEEIANLNSEPLRGLDAAHVTDPWDHLESRPGNLGVEVPGHCQGSADILVAVQQQCRHRDVREDVAEIRFGECTCHRPKAARMNLEHDSSEFL